MENEAGRTALVAKEVAKAMVDCGIRSGSALARATGLSPQAISKLLLTGAGSLELKRKVAEALHRPFNDLFPEDAKRLHDLLSGGDTDGGSDDGAPDPAPGAAAPEGGAGSGNPADQPGHRVPVGT